MTSYACWDDDDDDWGTWDPWNEDDDDDGSYDYDSWTDAGWDGYGSNGKDDGGGSDYDYDDYYGYGVVITPDDNDNDDDWWRQPDQGDDYSNDENDIENINGTHSDIEPYILKETSVINTDVGYTIRCLRYNGWENETGDFNVIEINTGQGEVLNLQYDEGWERVSMPGLQYGNKSFYHETLVNGEVALFFTGATLMSQPPYLTIIILAHGRACLVFNKRMIVNNVVRENGDLLFNLQENVIEWTDEYTPADDAVLHTISIKNGLMYFE